MAEPVIDRPPCIEKGAEIVIELHVVAKCPSLSFAHLSKKKLRFPDFLVYSREIHLPLACQIAAP
jgi:hypothetical protein